MADEHIKKVVEITGEVSSSKSWVTDIMNSDDFTIKNSTMHYKMKDFKNLAISRAGFDPKSRVDSLLYELRSTPGIKCVLLYHNNIDTKLASQTGKGSEIRDSLTLETHMSQNEKVIKSEVKFPPDTSLQAYIHNMRHAQGICLKKPFIIFMNP